VRVIRERIVSGAVPSELIRRILPSREFKSCAPAAQRAVPVVIQSLPSGLESVGRKPSIEAR